MKCHLAQHRYITYFIKYQVLQYIYSSRGIKFVTTDLSYIQCINSLASKGLSHCLERRFGTDFPMMLFHPPQDFDASGAAGSNAGSSNSSASGRSSNSRSASCLDSKKLQITSISPITPVSRCRSCLGALLL